MNTYPFMYSDLANILRSCADYIENTDEESAIDYFDEFIDSGLFFDAMGKVINSSRGFAEIITEY